MAELERPSDEFVDRVHGWYQDAAKHSGTWRLAARESYDFYAGTQWSEQDRAVLEDQQRPPVTLNRVVRVVNAVVGTEIGNRHEVRYIPRELGDVEVNEILTGAAAWVRDECDAEDEESDAFADMTICGMGWIETRITYDEEPDGKILIERYDPLEAYWDPMARKKNLSDARWMMRIREFDPDTFDKLWPDAPDVDGGGPWDSPTADDLNLQEHVYPQDAYNVDRNRERGRGRRKVRVAQVQWWEHEDVWRVGEAATVMKSKQFERLRPELEARGIPFMRQKRKVFRQAFVAGGSVLEKADCPYPDGFTLRCMTGMRDRNNNYWYGLVEQMKDPQRWGNKFFSQILDIINKNSKGGVIAEKEAVDDPRQIEQDWARPDGVIWVRPGAVQRGQIMPKPKADVPTGLDRMMIFALEGVHDIAGVSLEMLGTASRDQPGILEYHRKQSGLTILAHLFDAARKYRKEQGRVLLYYIQTYLSDDRLIRILGEDGKPQFVPLSRQTRTARYDVIVEEAPTSPNQRERVLAMLGQMMPILGKMGIPLPPEILDYAPLPSGLAEKWKEMVSKGSQIPPELQQQLQKLSEENRELKSKREERMNELQLKRIAAAEDATLDREKLVLEREKADLELQLKRAEAEAEMALKRSEVEAELDLKWAEFHGKQQVELAKLGYKEETNGSGPRRRRRISVARNAEGFIESADIEDIFDEIGHPQGSA